jgi:hypothetical protein
MQWGDQHLPDPKGPPIVLHHQPCGQIAKPVLVCAHCRQEITAHNVTPEPGPGFQTEPPTLAGASPSKPQATRKTGY